MVVRVGKMLQNDPCQVMLVGAVPERRAFVSGCVMAWTERDISETYLMMAWWCVIIMRCDSRQGGC